MAPRMTLGCSSPSRALGPSQPLLLPSSHRSPHSSLSRPGGCRGPPHTCRAGLRAELGSLRPVWFFHLSFHICSWCIMAVPTGGVRRYLLVHGHSGTVIWPTSFLVFPIRAYCESTGGALRPHLGQEGPGVGAGRAELSHPELWKLRAPPALPPSTPCATCDPRTSSLLFVCGSRCGDETGGAVLFSFLI